MNPLIRKWLLTLYDVLLKMKNDLEIEKNEIIRLTQESEYKINTYRDNYRHGNMSLIERDIMIDRENPNRIMINRRGDKYISCRSYIHSIEEDMDVVLQKLDCFDVDDSFLSVMQNIDYRVSLYNY
jgi:hypothetical protein|tara:strand:+ start:340 stop:717 length:378 start_codon:yes stop_codon:yes gene_type:complete